jgi:hypothetical protein
MLWDGMNSAALGRYVGYRAWPLNPGFDPSAALPAGNWKLEW